MSSHLRKLFSNRFFTKGQKWTHAEQYEAKDDLEDDLHLSNPIFPAEAKLFQRQSLRSENEIRLVRLLPARDSLILRGEFVHVSISDPEVQYKAISYCWGKDPLDQQFWVSQRDYIPMTPSLHSILQVLRSEGEQHLYWIDALCIDQSNKAEQTHQIRLMRNIFATAQHVIAFIGEPSEDSDIAMQFLKRLELSLSGLNLMRGNGLLHQVDENLDMNIQTLVQIDLTRYPSVGWSALKNLLLRPWFQRSWCIQECVVAQDIILRCGAETVK